MLFRSPFNTMKRLVCVFPKNAEKEKGFSTILARIRNLALNNGIYLSIFAEDATLELIRNFKTDRQIETEYISLSNWEDFLYVSSKVQENVGLFVFMSRRGSISYNSEMPRISKYLDMYFMGTSFILAYPAQYSNDNKRSTVSL